MSAMLVSATLLISGCPAQITDPGDNPGKNPGTNPGGEPQQYDIILTRAPTNGTVEISPVSRRAAKDDPVTITLIPAAGYEPENLVVLETGNFTVAVTPLPSPAYTYTFTMPASLVRISVDFSLLSTALINAHNRISVFSSWDEIDALNELIKKYQRQNPSDRTTIVNTAINNLVAGSTAEISSPGTPATGVNPAGTLGIIPAKMQIEDLTKWIPLNYPSYPIDKGVAYTVTPSGGSPTTYRNRTHLYYVKEDNPTIPPAAPPEKGWKAGLPSTITGTAGTDPIDLDGVQEILLFYEVGINSANIFYYQMWLWPSAQYTIQYEPGASGLVTIQDYYIERPSVPSGTSITIPAANTASQTPQPDGVQTLSANGQQKTGQVGRVNTPASSTPAYDRAVFTVIRPQSNSILIHVTTSSGTFVTNVYSKSGTSPNETETISTIASSSNLLNDVRSNNYGAFYPESRKYIIRVWAYTPPTS